MESYTQAHNQEIACWYQQRDAFMKTYRGMNPPIYNYLEEKTRRPRASYQGPVIGYS